MVDCLEESGDIVVPHEIVHSVNFLQLSICSFHILRDAFPQKTCATAAIASIRFGIESTMRDNDFILNLQIVFVEIRSKQFGI